MGFNLGVEAIGDRYADCSQFLERTFYNWVMGQSKNTCIQQTARYFNLDLTPLNKVFFSTGIDYGQDTAAELAKYIQKTAFLLELVQQLLQKVNEDPLFVDQLEVFSPDKPTTAQRAKAIQFLGRDPFAPFEHSIQHPYRAYIAEGHLANHLRILKEILACYLVPCNAS